MHRRWNTAGDAPQVIHRKYHILRSQSDNFSLVNQTRSEKTSGPNSRPYVLKEGGLRAGRGCLPFGDKLSGLGGKILRCTKKNWDWNLERSGWLVAKYWGLSLLDLRYFESIDKAATCSRGLGVWMCWMNLVERGCAQEFEEKLIIPVREMQAVCAKKFSLFKFLPG